MPSPTTIRLLTFLLLVVVADRGAAALLERLSKRIFTGERGGLTNAALHANADVLVLGSSRAQFQIMPAVLHSELGVEAYNAGLKGHDLLYSALLAELWRARHPAPRAYVLNIDVESLLVREREHAAAGLLAPFIDESVSVREVLYAMGPFKPAMYLSQSYRYNGRVFPILKNLLHTRSNGASQDGFLAAKGVFDANSAVPRYGMNDLPSVGAPSAAAAVQSSQAPYSALRVQLLRRLALRAQSDRARLFLVHTPIWGLPPEAHANFMRRLHDVTDDLGSVEVLDLCEVAYPELFAGRADLRYDFNHLNEAGARILSELLARRMRVSLPAQTRAAVPTGSGP